MKFIASYFDKETNISTVILEHMGKQFKGTARLHPEDIDKKSEIVGGSYAEMRATIAALRYEHKIAKEKCEECRKFVRACQCYKDFDKESPTARIIYKQLRKRINKVNELAEEINKLYFLLETSIKTRDTVLKKLNESKEIKEQKTKIIYYVK